MIIGKIGQNCYWLNHIGRFINHNDLENWSKLVLVESHWSSHQYYLETWSTLASFESHWSPHHYNDLGNWSELVLVESHWWHDDDDVEDWLKLASRCWLNHIDSYR